MSSISIHDDPAARAGGIGGPAARTRTDRILVVLVDENSLTRDCFALSLGTLGEGMTVIPVASLREAGDLMAGGERIDVVLCHIGADRALGEARTAALREDGAPVRDTPLIIISDRDDIDLILECLGLGVRGYIVSSLGLGVALEAIRLVVAGGTFVPASSLHKLTRFGGPRGEPAASAQASMEGLTPRELAVLKCLHEGKSNKLIAYQLGMCENTAKAHVRNILKKMGATNRTEAAYLAHRCLLDNAPPAAAQA
ncbi:response regulator transcription factor [Azospirillum agricola]|uniref:response regulator transcription factor n=1 Tax=Azospirillum agricola TaxID=1720247 RepID=UPI000A0EEEBB|nr:response regulator transcription factor [Azospirillum agricola]SMH47476.1 DNA-binding response regulator, NarL/FixJ family, contains REC and HTH domains [Azospirillum lipoferum]